MLKLPISIFKNKKVGNLPFSLISHALNTKCRFVYKVCIFLQMGLKLVSWGGSISEHVACFVAVAELFFFFFSGSNYFSSFRYNFTTLSLDFCYEALIMWCTFVPIFFSGLSFRWYVYVYIYCGCS